ncbi:tRNA-uridine aminocarboxypropyltransferase [Thalassotalea euphylliae]|uniref:tRNA-uridine aminocarboxypropyltransferase n=1 Tax=Thalassotalea euphylliae TaxID=1655234 RepID=UPI00362D11ED
MQRCELCQVAMQNCICHFRKQAKTDAAFLLLMHDAEVLKPSNTARLIADVVADTHCFLWSRTEINSQLSALLADKKYFPVVVFPGVYAGENQTVYENFLPDNTVADLTPLFILLDGSWREAKKMFRKSPYLNELAILSFTGAGIEADSQQYNRKAEVDNQFATAQVAARSLAAMNESNAAKHLSLWFEVFNYQYQQSVCQVNLGRADALNDYLNHVQIIQD